MHVLVSCKTTNLDVHGEQIRRKIAAGLLSQDHLDRLQEDHRQHYQSLEILQEELTRRQISFVEVGRGLYWPDLVGVDAIITLGGDGTVLEASRHIIEEAIPVLGVRSSDMSVGHLCACYADGIAGMIEKLAEGSLQTRELSRLMAKIRVTESGGELITEPVLNDFLYSSRNPAATSRYGISLGSVREIQKSSGIWLAAPAGSTAAIAAAGGTPVSLDRADFQYVVREPYTPPGRAAYQIDKGFFDPDQDSLVIENHCEEAILALDGQRGQVSLKFGDTITFLRAPSLQVFRRAL